MQHEQVTIVIDGDQVAYRNAAACTMEVDWGENDDSVPDEYGDENQAKAKAAAQIDHWAADFFADRVIVAMSDSDRWYWRHELYPEYKEGRGKPPEILANVRQMLYDQYRIVEFPELEADDVMGIIATDPRVEGEVILISSDKDMKTIPGQWFNPDKGGVPEQITEEEAQWNHLYQTLTGDTCDGYKGCPGIGPVKAAETLGPIEEFNHREAWQRVCMAFLEQGEDTEEAVLQARLARILHYPEYNQEKQEVLLWTPS